MVYVPKPTLHPSADGAAALVRGRTGWYEAYSLPAASARPFVGLGRGAEGAVISADGLAVAYRTADGRVHAADRVRARDLRVPFPESAIEAMAVADDARIVVTVRAATGGETDGGVADADRRAVVVDLWSTDGSPGVPLASARAAARDNLWLSIDGRCSVVALYSESPFDGESSFAAWRRTSTGDLAAVAVPPTLEPAIGRAIAVDGRLVVVAADSLVAFLQDGSRPSIPGDLQLRLRGAPDGKHVVVWRQEDSRPGTRARYHVRLFEIDSLRLVREARHDLDCPLGCEFVVDGSLALHAVVLDDDETLTVEDLDWE